MGENASQDGSCDRIPTDFPEVSLIRLERNIGFEAGNNLASRVALDRLGLNAIRHWYYRHFSNITITIVKH